MWTEYGDEGLMVLTILTSNADGSAPSAADSRAWAGAYGSSHPILADTEGGISRDVMGGRYNYPFFMLVDRGMVIHALGEGEGSIPEADILALL